MAHNHHSSADTNSLSLNPSEFTITSASLKSSGTLGTLHEVTSSRGTHKTGSQHLTVPHAGEKHSKQSTVGHINSSKLDAYLAGAPSRAMTRK